MFFDVFFTGFWGTPRGGCGQRALSYTPPNVLKAFKARIRCFKRFKTFERSHMTLLEHFYNFSFFSKIFEFLDFFLSHGHQALAVRESPKGDDQTGKTAETDICFWRQYTSQNIWQSVSKFSFFWRRTRWHTRERRSRPSVRLSCDGFLILTGARS